MISKCPECGRSYPTHHGSMCKLCATKKTRENEISKLQEVPVIETKPETVEQAPVIEEKVIETNLTNEIDMTSLTTGGTLKESKKNSDEEKIEGLEEVCPDCLTINANNDIFCSNCGKMLLSSQQMGKNKDYQISEIKGIFPDQINKLKKANINTTLQLLDKGYSLSKRKLLAVKIGIPEILIYRMVNQADLLRIDGVEPNEAYMLELIGLNTIRGLEKKTYQDVVKTINLKKSILYSKQVIILPEDKKVKKWIDQLSTIEKLVNQ